MQSKTKHVQRNKLSEKLNRRDVGYYDLYHLNDPRDDFNKLRTEGGYPYSRTDAKISELYGDMAYPDFNIVFKCHGEIVNK